MNNLIDTHFHIMGIKNKDIKIEELIKDLKNTGFYGGIDICLTVNDIQQRKKYFENFNKVFFATGFGPWFLEDKNFNIDINLKQLKETLIKYKINALGEIGLDYHYLSDSKEKEQELFIKQLQLANLLKLPVIIHNRDSDEDLIKILDKYPPNHGCIMHCFSSTPEFCLKLVQKGFYISFAGNLTFKHSENLQEAIKVVPSEKLLLETDSPYLSPIPLRGRINTPLNIIYTYKKAAELRNISVEILIDQIINNFENFSKLLTQN